MKRSYVGLLLGIMFLLMMTACSESSSSPVSTSEASPVAVMETPISTDKSSSTIYTPTASTSGISETASLSEPEAAEGVAIIKPQLETISVLGDIAVSPNNEHLGDADDPAIWVHPTNPELSLIAVVLKEGGLDVFDLNGQVVQRIAPEGVRYNNIDVVYQVPFGGTPVDMLVATDRYQDRMVIFKVDPASRQLIDITDPEGALLFTPAGQESDKKTTAYGIAVAKDTESNNVYAFVNRRDTGEIAQFALVDKGNNRIGWNKIRTMMVPPPEGGEEEDAQTEGMVVDPEAGFLYVGQENGGIWKFSDDPNGSNEGTLIHPITPDKGYLEADVEGLTIYFGPNGQGYLIASSQGNNTFAVFRREGNNDYLGSFQIGSAGDIDGVQECDGAMVMNIPMGEQFPNGLLVVQDGHNVPLFPVEDDGEIENASTNFKFVRWEDVAAAFTPPLMIDTASYHPRNP